MNSTAYLLLAAMIVVPQFILVHPYLHLLIMAPLLVWIGCQNSLAESAKAPGDSQVETVSKKDAMQFPLIGSCVLFGLYVVVKYVSKTYLDVLISCYFGLLGSGGVFQTIRDPVSQLLGAQSMKKFSFSLRWQFWKSKDESEPLAFDYNMLDVLLLLGSVCISLSYAYFKTWWLNNMLGCAFSIQGIQMISLGSYMIGVLMLCGLFFYDVRGPG